MGLFGGIAYLETRDPLALVVVGVSLLLLIVAFFPTKARLRRFTG